jgi:hypothetical protein
LRVGLSLRERPLNEPLSLRERALNEPFSLGERGRGEGRAFIIFNHLFKAQ